MALVQDGTTYKILNTVSQQVLRISAGSNNDVAVIADPWAKIANQCWKAQAKPNNQFEFAVANQPTKGVTYVLDASQSKLGQVCIYTSRGSVNQRWSIEPIKPNAFLCYIKNMSDGRVLEFEGSKNNVRMAQKAGTPNQFWTFNQH